jgi:hypothetical protein
MRRAAVTVRSDVLFCCVVACAWPAPARADAPKTEARRLLVGAELGFAFPTGSLEQEAPVSDVVRGVVPLAVEVGWRAEPSIFLLAYAQYAPGVPKLCATTSDCIASLGHDIALGVGGRFVLRGAGPVQPEGRLAFGYEWFEAELSDQGVTSARHYRGPMLVSLEASGNIGSEDRTIGLFTSLSVGLFTHRGLDTPAFTSGADIEHKEIHLWLGLGIRGALSIW